MSEEGRFESKRTRTILGVVVVAASLVVAAALAGIGFAFSGISAQQYQYGKVTMCHKTHSKKNPYVTIVVSKNAVAAHKKHGDTLGPCPPSTGKPGNNHPGNPHGTTTTTTTTATPAPSQPGNNGNGNGGGKPADTPGNGPGGNGNGHGDNGKGHGK